MADNAEITKIDETTREKLRQTVAKIERLEEEKKEVAEQIKEQVKQELREDLEKQQE